MTADTSLKVLVIILSTTLAVVLILAIVLIAKLIQVANAIKRVTAKAEQIAGKAEAAADFFEKAAGPAAVGKFLSNIIEVVHNHKRKRD